jgi:ParB family transcriptional regulator, chromosome partitioning protein
LTPLEEASALTKLIHKGTTLDDVAARTGLSQTTIKRRLALNGLCEETRAALALGILSLSQAEAMTLGGDDMQRTVLEEIERGIAFSADDIKVSIGMQKGPRIGVQKGPHCGVGASLSR